MTYAQASEQVFWQRRTHCRRWRCLTGKPVQKFRRHVRYVVNVRRPGRGRRHSGSGFGGHRGRRSYVIAQDDVWAYFGARRKGSGRGAGAGHGRKRNPRGIDGQVMTCCVCNSEEQVAAKCPQGQGGGRGSGWSGLPSATFHVSEGRQAAGRPALTWSGRGADDDVDGPLASVFRELGSVSDDYTYMAAQAEDVPM